MSIVSHFLVAIAESCHSFQHSGGSLITRRVGHSGGSLITRRGEGEKCADSLITSLEGLRLDRSTARYIYRE